MKPNVKCLLGALALLLILPTAVLAAPTQPIAEVENLGDTLIFHPVTEYASLVLTVTGPCDFQYRQVVTRDEPVFRLDETTIDGVYRYNLMREESINPDVIKQLLLARKNNDPEVPKTLCRQGLLPEPPISQSEGFRVFEGRIIYDHESIEKTARLDADTAGAGATAGRGSGSVVPTKDFVINDDLIVDGSACIGFDCVNGESFGFDTIRLKENNLRIKFDDTSTAASFPRNDWQLTANDSANGGASKFSIDDISGSRTPFTVEANARSHSLYVDDGGRIGSRTSTPSVEIHTIDGDTPTLRLQQDGSSGFAPQTWDVAGNETNFFVRDVTNGSQLPFRIRPDAPSSSIFIDVDGSVGLGTSSPDADLHIANTSGNTEIQMDTAAQSWKWRVLDSGSHLVVIDNTNSKTPFRLAPNTDTNVFSIGINTAGTDAPTTVSFGRDTGPNVTVDIQGSVIVDGTTVHADYVFEPDYGLESIADHAEFMWENKHLPALPKAPEGGTGRVDIVSHQMGILEELEKAHIYIEQLHQAMATQDAAILELTRRLEELEAEK